MKIFLENLFEILHQIATGLAAVFYATSEVLRIIREWTEPGEDEPEPEKKRKKGRS